MEPLLSQGTSSRGVGFHENDPFITCIFLLTACILFILLKTPRRGRGSPQGVQKGYRPHTKQNW